VITWLKFGGIAAALLGLFAFGYWTGEREGNLKLQTEEAQIATATANSLETQRMQYEAQAAAQQKRIDAYDALKDIPDIISLPLATRVLLGTACPDRSAVSDTAAGAGRAQGASGVPASDAEAVRLLSNVFAAGGRDSLRLDLLRNCQQLAP